MGFIVELRETGKLGCTEKEGKRMPSILEKKGKVGNYRLKPGVRAQEGLVVRGGTGGLKLL